MAPPPFPAADVRWQWRGVGHIGARRADGAPSPDVTLGHAAQAARLRSRAVRRAIARRTALLRQHERHRISTPNAASATRPARGAVAISFYLSGAVLLTVQARVDLKLAGETAELTKSGEGRRSFRARINR